MQSARDEINKYISYKFPAGTDTSIFWAKDTNGNYTYNVLDWWKKNEDKFPVLSLVARFVLALPASSAKSECNFSDAGNTLTELRTNLSPNHVDELVFLKSNSDLLSGTLEGVEGQ